MKIATSPAALKARFRKLFPNQSRQLAAVAKLLRSDKHECNLCGYTGKFMPFGDPPRRGATCAKCDSVERHRLMGLWLEANPGIIDNGRTLHFAPERALTQSFKARSGTYISADLRPGAADRVLNIEDIDFPDESFDLVVCCHVLEHVDDAKALQNIYRVLAPGGRALLMFPIVEGWDRTYEDPVHTSPEARTIYFGQDDHVRIFGRDVRDRITNNGFRLTEFTAEEPDVARYGLVRGEKLFIATKPTQSATGEPPGTVTMTV